MAAMARRSTSVEPHAGPLAGASVVVTRPSASAAALRRRVRALGGNAIGLPGIGLHAAADAASARRALRAARSADVVIFLSPAAVRFAWTLAPRLRFSRATWVCAPGAGSARALRRRGIADPQFPTQRQDSEGLLNLPLLARIRRRRIVLVGAPGGRDLLPRELRARGARVMLAEVYRRAPARLDRRHFAALERASAPLISLVSSAEALTNLHACLPPALFARLATGECIVSSARLAEVARTLGIVRVHPAASADPAALLAAACSALARHRL